MEWHLKKLPVSERVDLLLCKCCMDSGQTRIKGPSANVWLGGRHCILALVASVVGGKSGRLMDHGRSSVV